MGEIERDWDSIEDSKVESGDSRSGRGVSTGELTGDSTTEIGVEESGETGETGEAGETGETGDDAKDDCEEDGESLSFLFS